MKDSCHLSHGPDAETFAYPFIKALLIDIDDTVVCFKPGAKTDGLMEALHSAAIELSGLTPQEAASRIEKVKNEIRWWHTSDFIVALGLNPKKFWNYARARERTGLEPSGPEIRGALERLHAAGIRLYITSNNPSSGILHKLSIAGLATIQGAPLFSQLLGATELQSMKWEGRYWHKVLAHIGFDGHEVAVVGDNPRDDLEVPQSIGIAHTFLIDRHCDRSPENSQAVTHVMNFDSVAACILGDAGYGIAAKPGAIAPTAKATCMARR